MEEKKNILIVEDEKPMALALRNKINHAGFNVTAVFNGEEALEAFGKEQFDLALMDLMMPQMDGFTLLQKLRDQGITTPVIVSSNLSQESDMEKAKALGAVGFFVKSNTPIKEVVEIIEQALT